LATGPPTPTLLCKFKYWNNSVIIIIIKKNFNKKCRKGILPQARVSFNKYMPPSSSLLQGKHLPFSSSPLRLNIFRLFVILSLTQLYRYTPEIFLFSTATFKYTYRAPSDELDKNIQRMSHFLLLIHWNGYSHFRFALDFSYAFGNL
jgi:hypothetical protein